MSTPMPHEATVLHFVVSHQPFALDVRAVREVQRMVAIRPIAGLPPDAELLGVVDARGQTVPVLDLSRRVNLAVTPLNTQDAALIFVQSQERLLALPVERAVGIVHIPETELPAPGAGWDCVRGLIRMNDGLVTMLDADKLPTLALKAFWGVTKYEPAATHC
jgi:chemotaxis signal transduction protein